MIHYVKHSLLLYILIAKKKERNNWSLFISNIAKIIDREISTSNQNNKLSYEQNSIQLILI